MQIFDSTKYQSPLPNAQAVSYHPNMFLGISKPNRDDPVEIKPATLLRNLAEVIEENPSCLIFETERIDGPEWNSIRALINDLVSSVFSHLLPNTPWGVFEQPGDTHVLEAFLDIYNKNRANVFQRARSVTPIGNCCFTPFYIKSRKWLDRLAPDSWRAALRSKIDCCRQAGYGRVCLTITPYIADEFTTEFKASIGPEAAWIATVPLCLKHYIGDSFFQAAVEECCTYGDGVNIWTHPIDGIHEEVFSLLSNP